MIILEQAYSMLEKYRLCDHCLGRQFALLGHGLENDERGKALKLALGLEAHRNAQSGDETGIQMLRTLFLKGFSENASETLQKLDIKILKKGSGKCYLCENTFKHVESLVEEAVNFLGEYEYHDFLVGTELPLAVQEREDEFKAEFSVSQGEDLRNEFGRTIGKRIAEHTGKDVDFLKPDIVVLVNPFTKMVQLQVNPLFVAGRYRKLVRGIPQSTWFCSNCRGKGCKKCDWTGKLYSESVEEIIEKPLLEATDGVKGSFHASGREDIDARMLGNGRPFIIEISQPKKRFISLAKMKYAINTWGKDKIKTSKLSFVDKDDVRKLKRGESSQKEYRVWIKFDAGIVPNDLKILEEKLSKISIKQRTPIRVLHRRADLIREKYIYDVKVKKLSNNTAEMIVRCQGGLYVKELVSGDEGRTTPSVSEILNSKAKPLKLDVLKVIMEEQEGPEK